MNTSDIEYKQNKEQAIKMFNSGESPIYSTGICENITAGYGKVDEFGYFEYPLPVNQRSMKVEV